MHVHWRQVPSAASLVALVTVLATVTLLGCADFQDFAKRAQAADYLKVGDAMSALAVLAPPPFNLLIPCGVLIGGHLASTILRRGSRPPTEPKPKGLRKKPIARVDNPTLSGRQSPVA